MGCCQARVAHPDAAAVAAEDSPAQLQAQIGNGYAHTLVHEAAQQSPERSSISQIIPQESDTDPNSVPSFDYVHTSLKLFCLDVFTSKHTGQQMQKWRQAMVADFISDEQIVRIHFDGWSDRHDINLVLDHEWRRLAPLWLLDNDSVAYGQSLSAEQEAIVRRWLQSGGMPEDQGSTPDLDSDQLTTQHQVGDKVEVEDFYRSKTTGKLTAKWRPAKVIAIAGGGRLVKIHYEGWDNRWDEVIDLEQHPERIRACDTHGIAAPPTATVAPGPLHAQQPNGEWDAAAPHPRLSKHRSSYAISRNAEYSIASTTNPAMRGMRRANSSPGIPRDMTAMTASLTFRDRMQERGLVVVDVEGDGNCLFRAVCDQMYSSDKKHAELRRKCIHHMRKHKDRFSVFCVDDFDEYLDRMSRLCEWADDLEIRALEEIFDRPIQIFRAESYDLEPMKTHFDEEELIKDVVPIKLSYHGRSHYNSVHDRRHPVPLSPRKSHVLVDVRSRLLLTSERK